MAQGFIILEGYCFERDLLFPYAPMIDALRTFLAPQPPAGQLGRSGVEAVVFAVATATASVEQELAGGVDPKRARQFAAQLTGRARRVTAEPAGRPVHEAADPAARSGT